MWIAKVDVLDGRLREARLDREDGRRVLLRLRLLLSREREHRGDVSAVGGAHLGLVRVRLRGVVEVVLALWEPEPVLPHDEVLARRVLVVRAGADGEERVAAEELKVGDGARERSPVLDGRDARELAAQRCAVLGAPLVHARRPEVAELVRVRIVAPSSRGVALEDRTQPREVLLVEGAAAPEARPVRRDGMCLHPPAARVLVEVVARLRLGVERSLVDARRGGLRRRRRVRRDRRRRGRRWLGRRCRAAREGHREQRQGEQEALHGSGVPRSGRGYACRRWRSRHVRPLAHRRPVHRPGLRRRHRVVPVARLDLGF